MKFSRRKRRFIGGYFKVNLSGSSVRYDFDNGLEKSVSEDLEEILNLANKSLRLYRFSLIGGIASAIISYSFPWLLLVSVACLALFLYVNKNGVIELEYVFEDEEAAVADKRMKPLVKMIQSKKLWYITQMDKVVNEKYSGGAGSTVKRQNCKAFAKLPFPFKTNSVAVSFKCGSKTLAFLPDKLFVLYDTKIDAIDYSDVITSVHGRRFIENKSVPEDARVVAHIWKHMNKSGVPDKRFKNNKRLPVCLYGEMEVRSVYGINTDIIFSNPNLL